MPQRAIFDIAEFKALESEQETEGRFEAIVSVFGNEDRQGERVVEGAFVKSLAQWQASGHPIPIIWSHQWGNPEAHIGSARPEDVVEVSGKGLKVAGAIDLDDRFSAKVFKLMKQGRVKEFSFGFAVRKQRRAKDGVNELLELDLIEVGPTLKGVNPSTELLAIKSELEADEQKSPPWHIAQDVEDCVGFAVVTDESGEVVGCHDIRAAAERQMAALYANAKEAEKAEIPQAIVDYIDLKFDLKAGRSISGKNESKIRGAVDALSEVLASLGGATDEAEASETEEAKAKADEPKVATNSGVLELRALIMNAKE